MCWEYLQHYGTDYNYAVLQEITPKIKKEIPSKKKREKYGKKVG